MEILVRTRLGIGFDIEHNEDICHRAAAFDEKGKEEELILCFVGLLLKVPFLTIYFGEFMDRRDMTDD
jgi:hypothetical protein